MSATTYQPPSPEDLAWADDLLERARSEVFNLVEAFERHLEQRGGEYPPISLEEYGRLMMVTREARHNADELVELAGKLEAFAYEMYRSNGDKIGVVASALGVESYVDYRRRLAARYHEMADDAESIVTQLEDGGAS